MFSLCKVNVLIIKNEFGLLCEKHALNTNPGVGFYQRREVGHFKVILNILSQNSLYLTYTNFGRTVK